MALLVALVATPAAAARRPKVPGLCAALAGSAGTTRLAVLSAFQAELAPLVRAATIEQTRTVDGRSYYLATLAGVRVVLGMLGIGTVNAETRAQSVLDNFDVAALLVSGVAGSEHPIGDVTVPAEWFEFDARRPVRPNVALQAAAAAAAPGAVLISCRPEAPAVCLPAAPEVLPGGTGHTSDPFNKQAFPCSTGDLFGCDLPAPALAGVAAARPPTTFDVQDMETASAGRVATEHRVPWIAFRAVSDSDFSQFADYYHLAAENAAAVTVATLGRIGALAGDRRTCALLAHRQWRPAAHRLARPRT